jgi:copper chaperone CopZ
MKALNKIVIGTLLKFVKLQVLHSIPGRIRIKLPGLSHFKNKVSADHNAILPYKLKGVESIAVNFINSTVLIHYDEQVTNPEQITGWLNRLREIIIEKMKLNINKPDAQLIDDIVLELKKDGYEMEK